MNSFRKILISIQTCVYGIALILAILTVCRVVNYWDVMQAKTIITGSFACLLFIWFTVLIEKFTKVRLSLLVDIGIAMSLFLGVLVGECFLGFYKIKYYDRVLHFLGTLELCVLGYAIAKVMLRQFSAKGKNQLLFAIFFGFFFAMALEALWELYEWSADTLFGTNMQKFIPNEFLVQLDENLAIPEDMKEEIFNFYSQREGYHFAVMDTMWDIVMDLLGALSGALITYFVMKEKPELQDRILYLSNEDEIIQLIKENSNE